MTTFKHVLVATDFSAPSQVALNYGRDLARPSGATLHLLHVIQEIPTYYGSEVGLEVANIERNIEASVQREFDAALAGLDAGVVVRTAISHAANIAEAINAYAAANHADIIVVGTHGRGAVSRFLMGSVAERVVRSAPCPVLTVHAHESDFASPPPSGAETGSTVSSGA